jgi:hypothetical protein
MQRAERARPIKCTARFLFGRQFQRFNRFRAIAKHWRVVAFGNSQEQRFAGAFGSKIPLQSLSQHGSVHSYDVAGSGVIISRPSEYMLANFRFMNLVGTFFYDAIRIDLLLPVARNIIQV